jgi:hypothetical protein
MDHSRIAALAVAAALAIGLTACGGGGSDSGSSASSTPETTPPTNETAESSGGSGALTPPGTKLKTGQEATVAWVPPSTYSATGGQEGLKLRVAVEAIEKGSIDDFENVELEPDQEDATPFYVKVKVEAIDEYKGESVDDPDVSFTAIDDRGQEQSSITFFGDFEACSDESVPKPFTPGDSFESCLAYLMPGGGAIKSVEWDSGPSEPNEVTPYFDEPIVWEGS